MEARQGIGFCVGTIIGILTGPCSTTSDWVVALTDL